MNVDALADLEQDERAVFFLRRHWLLFFGDLFMIGIIAVVPVGAWFLLLKLWPTLLMGPVTRPLLILLTSAFYLITWLFFITSFVNYYLTAWIVTTHKIVSIEQKGLFARTVSELDLLRVQDVTSEVKGILPSMFNYGDVYVQTAGEVERFDFERVHRPDIVRKRILELAEEYRKNAHEPTNPEL